MGVIIVFILIAAFLFLGSKSDEPKKGCLSAILKAVVIVIIAIVLVRLGFRGFFG